MGLCIHCGQDTGRSASAKRCHLCAEIVGKIQRSAIAIVNYNVTRDLLPKADTLVCVDCGAQAKEYDHRDYGKPLSVAPVCVKCNIKRGPAMTTERKLWQRITHSRHQSASDGIKATDEND